MEKKTILVIDDDKNVHNILKIALEYEGFRVLAALDPMLGVKTARENKPDLIILDAMMPAGGGALAYERLRGLNTTFQIPIIVHSSLPPSQVKDYMPAPDHMIVQKPASLPDLINLIKQVLSGEIGSI
ncbi:MAG: response regulator [Elusimicrobiota bacterium]|jgi:DNA-binding response OmpR family regulator